MGGDNMSEWISTKDRLPNDKDYFFVVYGENIKMNLLNSKNKISEQLELECYRYEITGVTQLMLLPEPPKESENN